MTTLLVDGTAQVLAAAVLLAACLVLAPGPALVLLSGTACGLVAGALTRRSGSELAGADLAARTLRDTEVVTGLASLEVVTAEASGPALLRRWTAAARTGRSTHGRLRARAQRHGRLVALVDGAALVTALAWVGTSAPTRQLALLVVGSALQRSAQVLWRSGDELHASAAALRLRDDVTCAPELPRGTGPAWPSTRPAPGGGAVVDLRAVSYGHQRFRAPLFSGLDLHVPAGGRLVLTGPSGCGKSTVTGLLTGVLQAWDGTVEVDGRAPVVGGDDVACVPQRPLLVAGTVRDNLLLGREGDGSPGPARADDARLLEALRTVELDGVVSARGGLGAAVADGGSNFSGGERQRLALARALARSPRLLVLDESTSNLERPLEVRVLERVRQLPCTVVLVAHRLPPLAPDDRLVVLGPPRRVPSATVRPGRPAPVTV